MLSYRAAKPCQIFLGGGEGVLIVLSNAFSVIMTFQSAGLVVGEKVPSVKTSANSSLTMVRTFWVEAEIDMSTVVELSLFIWNRIEFVLIFLAFYFFFFFL
jgi:hypothetical protein